MGVMSIREFNSDTSGAFAKVEAGEAIMVTRNGRVFAEVVPRRLNKMDDPEYRAAYNRMMDGLREGIPA